MNKLRICLFVLMFTLCSNIFAQETNTWKNWEYLIGDWGGEGGGKPGQGNGQFSFSFDLDKKVIIRKSHTEFPTTANKAASTHNDLMVVYLNLKGEAYKAIYFDNEGHTINYTIAYFEKTIALTSEKIPNFPTFKLIYTFLDNETVNTTFQISIDGKSFNTYIEGKSVRKSKAAH